MYGWRGRIGLLVPSVNTVAEPEMNLIAPEGITAFAARMRNTKADLEDSLGLLNHVERATDELASAQVDVVAFTCTASSFVQGGRGEEGLRKLIEKTARVPSVTTSGAVVEALGKLKAKRLVIATPYPEEINQLEKAFFEEHGFEVLAIRGLGITDAFLIGCEMPETTYRFVKSMDDASADVIFISCTNYRTFDIIELLEEDCRKPVVTSNQATFWSALRTIGCRESIAGVGRLLQEF
jgi:maleate isomerase